MKHYGITGNMGSGKSTVAKLFEFFSIPLYSSDCRAKALMLQAPIKEELIQLLGKNCYHSDNSLNKVYIRSQIFNNSNLLKEMNAIVHPRVRQDYFDWRTLQNAEFTLQESALLFQTNGHKTMDGVISVIAPKELLIFRTMQRDIMSSNEVKKRLNKQLPQGELIKRSDFVINNDLGASLIRQVNHVYEQIIST